MTVRKFWRWLEGLLPLATLLIGIAAWALAVHFSGVQDSVFPSPRSVSVALWEELSSGRLLADLGASVFRVTSGFALGAIFGLPVGLLLGSLNAVRSLILPAVNFFRSLSSIAWIPFAVLWFGIGDAPVIFLIFIATFFPVVLATTAACVGIPQTYFHVAS